MLLQLAVLAASSSSCQLRKRPDKLKSPIAGLLHACRRLSPSYKAAGAPKAAGGGGMTFFGGFGGMTYTYGRLLRPWVTMMLHSASATASLA